ncbi:MAG TPA: hypothetical protein VN381_12010 [Anaerovoracaceae bacterium]|nr:hypothetical protein [Anaerovoracaceae bacterium]
MKEEVRRILKMVEEGKIDADKATELIEALNALPEAQQLPKLLTGDKMLRIKVISEHADNVNVNVPVSFLKSIGNAVNNIKIPGVSEQEGINIKMIMDAIDSGLEGKILDVKTGSGDFVEITIE